MNENVGAAASFLSAEELHRFAAWLEGSAAADVSLAEQLAKLPGGMNERLAHERMADAKAKQRIARELWSIEEATL